MNRTIWFMNEMSLVHERVGSWTRRMSLQDCELNMNRNEQIVSFIRSCSLVMNELVNRAPWLFHLNVSSHNYTIQYSIYPVYTGLPYQVLYIYTGIIIIFIWKKLKIVIINNIMWYNYYYHLIYRCAIPHRYSRKSATRTLVTRSDTRTDGRTHALPSLRAWDTLYPQN